MAEATEKCEKGKDPKKCTPEQIKECHGDTAKHPCGSAADKNAK
jgi:hypothetical protein